MPIKDTKAIIYLIVYSKLFSNLSIISCFSKLSCYVFGLIQTILKLFLFFGSILFYYLSCCDGHHGFGSWRIQRSSWICERMQNTHWNAGNHDGKNSNTYLPKCRYSYDGFSSKRIQRSSCLCKRMQTTHWSAGNRDGMNSKLLKLKLPSPIIRSPISIDRSPKSPRSTYSRLTSLTSTDPEVYWFYLPSIPSFTRAVLYAKYRVRQRFLSYISGQAKL